MESILDDDLEAVVDPWDDNMQPKKKGWPVLTFTCQTVWVDGQAKVSDSDKESSDDDELDCPDECKLVGKGAQKHHPLHPFHP